MTTCQILTPRHLYETRFVCSDYRFFSRKRTTFIHQKQAGWRGNTK